MYNNNYVSSSNSVAIDQLQPGKQKRIEILLVDDHSLFRGVIRRIIENQDDLVITGEASDGEEAVRIAPEVRPDIIIMDVNMPCMNGIEATRRITNDLSKVQVIGLSMNEEDVIAEEMKNAGASFYLQKSEAFPLLIKTIRRISTD